MRTFTLNDKQVEQYSTWQEEHRKTCRGLSNKALLAAYRRYNKDFDALEKERQKCWNRMMEIHETQDALGGERQMLSIEVRMNRKLKVS